MTAETFQRVVLTKDIPDEHLVAGDIGVVVETYRGPGGSPDGYELEFFTATGETIAVVSIPASSVREATDHDVLAAREYSRA